jgi:hypothetical protein
LKALKVPSVTPPKVEAPVVPTVMTSEPPKIIKATKENPVVVRGTTDTPPVTPDPLEFNKDTFDNIRVKGILDPKSLTQQEREFVAKVEVQRRDGKNIDDIFGITKPSTTSATYIDTVARDLSTMDAMSARGKLVQAGYSEQDMNTIMDRYLNYRDIEQQRQGINSNAIQRKADTETQLTYQYQSLVEEAKRSADRALKQAQRQASLSGVGRSTGTEQIMADIQRETDTYVNNIRMQEMIAKAKAEAEINGESAESISALDTRLRELQTEATNQQALIDARLTESDTKIREQYMLENKALIEGS